MKKLSYILLLFSLSLTAQNFTFENISKRTHLPSWEVIEAKGTVSINDSTIVFATQYNTQILKIVNSQRFIRHDDKIFSCLTNDNKKVNIRLYCDDESRNNFELYYYSNDVNGKYFRFCIKKQSEATKTTIVVLTD